MNNEQQGQSLKQLSIQLHLKISKIIVILGIIFFVVYCVFQFVLIFSLLSNLTKSEFSYLKSIGTAWALHQERERATFMNYLDSTSKILKSAYFNNKTNPNCNSEYFLCNATLNSTMKNYAPFDWAMRYVHANSGMLKGKSIAAVSLVNNEGQIFLNLSDLGLIHNTVLNLSSVIQQSNTSINSVSETSYYLNQKKVTTNSSIEVLCSKMEQSIAVCITSVVSLSSTIRPTSNFYITYTPTSSNSITYDQIHPIVAQHLHDIPSHQIQDITQCIQNYPFMLSKYLKTISALEIKCKHDSSKYLNWFGPTSAILSYQFSINLESGLKKQYTIFETHNISKTIFISSNSTYYHRQTAIVKQSLIDIRQSGYLLLSTLAACVFILHYSSYIFEDIFLKSVDIITTVSQALKNKEEKEFNRHLLRGYPQILTFIITYFQQFMWIHRLRKFKGKYKYKKLLLQGLQIFQQQKYIPVLKFIYIQLITLESQLVQRLFKIKQLPHKRRQMGSKCQQQQQRLHNPIIVNEQKVSKRRNANFNLLNPDDDELMKNISVSYRGNRGVRFSNDIQTIQIEEGPILRKAKFTQKPMVSCQTIKNDLSEAQNVEQSIKRSDFNKDSLKSLKSEQQSFTSLVDVGRGIKKKDSSTKTRSLQSIHVDLDNLKLDEQLEDDELLVDQESQQDQIYNMNREQITAMISQTYQTVIDYYQKLLDLLTGKIEKQVDEEIPELANYIYILTIRKYEKVHELLLYESQNQMERQERQAIDFKDFKHLQRHYNHYLSNELTQQAEVLRECILQALHSPISLSNLQDVYCKSNIKKIRIASRLLLARAAEELQPHLDLVIARNVYANLKQEKTTSTVKQESLTIFMRNLERYTNFWQELQELKMATQFYNTKNKKFYFLASISSIKTFTPVLSKFYELLDNFDIFNIYNLQEETPQTNEAETSENIILRTRRRCMSDKLKYLMDLQGFIEQFNYSCDRAKEQERANSVKTIVKKRIYEKQFHEILLTIEDDQVDYSKYVVIFLGDQHNSADNEESSNSANHRPYQQRIHSQITKIIEKGYLHFILVGFSLDVYPSKYGRLKRYVKLSPELFEVELSAKEQLQNLRRLEKYLR